MVWLFCFCQLSYLLDVRVVPCALAHLFFLLAFHVSSKDFCVRVYPARVTHALRGLLVRFFMILFIMGLVRNDSLLCRRDDLFNETVEAAVGQDACYLYVQTTSNCTIRIIDQDVSFHTIHATRLLSYASRHHSFFTITMFLLMFCAPPIVTAKPCPTSRFSSLETFISLINLLQMQKCRL